MASSRRLRKGDVVQCGQCGLAYVYRAKEETGCRRCGSRDLHRWRPQDDAGADPPAVTRFPER